MTSRVPVGSVNGIFATWLDFRRVMLRESPKDTLTYINTRLDLRLTPSNVSQYRNRKYSLPDGIGHLINEDLEALLFWLLERRGNLEVSDEQIKILKDALFLPVKSS